MKLLLDTQLLLWAAGEPTRLSAAARKLTFLTSDAQVAQYRGLVRKV